MREYPKFLLGTKATDLQEEITMLATNKYAYVRFLAYTVNGHAPYERVRFYKINNTWLHTLEVVAVGWVP